jgi:PhnB protein
MSVSPIPEGFHSLSPYLAVDDAAAAIRFYSAAFGATEELRLEVGGKIGHAEIRIRDSVLMLSDEWPEWNMLGPKSRGGPTCNLHLYVEDVDAAFARAVEAGATVERPVADQFYGDRSGTLSDPFGHRWNLATHVEDVTVEEMRRRMAGQSDAG